MNYYRILSNIGIMENKMEATIMGLYWVVVKVMVPFRVP